MAFVSDRNSRRLAAALLPVVMLPGPAAVESHGRARAAGPRSAAEAVNPVDGDRGFPLFVEKDVEIGSGTSAGPIAVGGDLTVAGSVGVASKSAGGFRAAGGERPAGLLVGHKIIWRRATTRPSVTVGSGAAVAVTDLDGTVAARLSGGRTRLTPGHRPTASPTQAATSRLSRPATPTATVTPTATATTATATTAPSKSAGPAPRPASRSNPKPAPVDFRGAFDTFRQRSARLAQCGGTVALSSPRAEPAARRIRAGDVALTLRRDRQNIVEVNAARLANVSAITVHNAPTARSPLIFNVDTAAVGNNVTWTPPRIDGIGAAGAAYVLFNFPTARRLTVNGSAPVTGTLYAPFAEVTDNGAGAAGTVVAARYARLGDGPVGGTAGHRFAAKVGGCDRTAPQRHAAAPDGAAAYRKATSGAQRLQGGGIVNGDFETGTLAGWTTAGVTAITSQVVHTGTYAARVGSTVAFNGDSSISQTFTPPAGNGTLSFWYSTRCSGSVVNNWVTATLRDNTSATTSTVLPNTCPGNSGYRQVTASVTAGHSYTITLLDHDDGVALTPAYAYFDDVAVNGLSISKTSDVTSVAQGGTVRYTITVTNSGDVPYTGAAISDPLGGVLDDANYNNDANANTGTVSFASPTLSWTGNLAVDATATITYTVTVKNPDPGDRLMLNTVSSSTGGSNCPSGGGTAACTRQVAVQGLSGLTISKAANVSSVTQGGTVNYTITVTNSGQVAYTGAAFTDPLGGVLDDANYNNDAAASTGSVSFSSPNLTWTGNLAVGASATITYSVTVKNPDTGDKTLSNTITSTTAGNNCTAGGGDPRCTTTVTVSILTIVNSSSVSTATPGQSVRFTVTLTNDGQTPYVGISADASTTDIFDDATYNGDETASSGVLSLSATAITWTGDIPVGGTVTITGTVTVNDPDTGDKLLHSAVVTAAPGSNCAAGSTDPQCAVNVQVLIPQLTISKTADVAVVPHDGTVHYTITVTNTGQTPYTGATFTDSLAGLLAQAVYNNDAAATSGSVSYTEPNLTWSGDLAVGASATITYSVTASVDQAGTDNVLVNTVVSTTVGSNCAAGSGDSRCTRLIPVIHPELTISKSADVESAVQGGTVNYRITVTNSAQVPFTGGALTDALTGVLDDANYNNDAAATSGTVAYSAPNLTWSGNLPVGASATITYSVTVKNPDLGNRSLANTVTSTSDENNCTAGSGDPRCTTTVPVNLSFPLTITKLADVESAPQGQAVNYTITVANSTALPVLGASFTDALGGVLDDADYNGDAAASTGSVSFSSPNLTWTGNVAAHATVTITYSVTIDDPDTGNLILTNTITSATIGNNCLAGSGDTRCAETVTVSILTLDFAANVASTTPGQVVRLTITITNDGQTPFSGIAASFPTSDFLDDSTYNGDIALSSGQLSLTGDTATWSGDVPVGGTVTISGTVTVNDPDTGNRDLISDISTPTPGSNCAFGSEDPRCLLNVPVLIPQLTFSKTANVPAALHGGTVTYTITVTNSGETPYTGASFTDSLINVLDEAHYNGDAAATSGTVSYTEPDLAWSGDLAVGASATITYSITVNLPHEEGDDDILSNTVLSTTTGSNCAAASGDARCGVNIPVLTQELTIAKSSDAPSAAQGGTVTYTITVTNSGTAPYSGATFTDSLDGVLDDADYNGDAAATSGTVSYASPNLTWTGNLAVGASATVTYSATVNDPDAGNKVLSNTVISGTTGNNCPLGGDDPRCIDTVTVSILTIRNSAGVTSATPGQVVRFTTTFTNDGQTPYAGISASTSTTDIFDDATYNGDETTTSGRLTLTLTSITWSGDIPVGGTVTITGTVTVKDPDTGNKLLHAVIATGAQGSNCPAGGSDPLCAVNVPILVPRLTLTKTADRAIARPGEVVHYTVTVANTGEVAFPDANFTDSLADVLDESAYDDDAAADVGTVSYTAPGLTWTGDLPVGATATVTYSITVSSQGQDDVLTNTVVSTTTGSNCAAGSTDAACTASVPVVPYTVSLTGLTDQFTLSGVPNGTSQQNDAVTMTVTSDNPAGYGLSVQGASAGLEPTLAGNTDTIPIEDLQVRDSGTAQTFQPLSATTPVSVFSRDTPTPPDGQTVGNDYRVVVPFVRPDTYSGDLTYVAMTS